MSERVKKPLTLAQKSWWLSSAKPLLALTKKQKEEMWKTIYSKCVRGSDEPDVVVFKVKKSNKFKKDKLKSNQTN